MELVKTKEDDVVPADVKRTVAGMITRYVECRFCGQVHALQYNELPETDAQMNDDAVMVCDCPSAREWQWMQKSAEESKKNLETLNEQIKTHFSEKVLDFCEKAIDLIAAGEIESQVITSGTKKITIKKKSKINIVVSVKKISEGSLEA
ncbi:hypothetical protein BXO88_02785 [Oribacterium sp. C9]|uniref:hypothetical protein n=1 Tax=Oribacterium sp. C9 TaxID=1943579 RepID=UPI00098EA434|nr:hypothetical protein [Oribacterium sp. C9]OON87620.1 hypothetical protein BXO88_02785 [Oribacterium sp. C9]